MSERKVRERLGDAGPLNNGREKVAVLDDAVRQADLLGDGRLQYDVRMELIDALHYVDEAV